MRAQAQTPVVLTALPDEWDGQIVGGLGHRVVVGRRCADLADLVAAAEAGLGDVALVSPRLRGLDLSIVRSLRLQSVGVVGVVEGEDEQGEARLRQIGVRTFVAPTASPADLFAAVVAGLAVPRDLQPGETEVVAEPPQAQPRGKVVVVWGPHGAPGRTTVAVNLAGELALAGARTALVDLDTHASSVAQHLAMLDEASGLASACHAADHGRLDMPGLGGHLLEVVPGLRVLTGIASAARWPEIRGGAVERVLDLAAAQADVVVVDVAAPLEDDEELSYDTAAPRRNMAALAALEVADEVVVVGAADPVGLQRLVRAVHDLGERGYAPTHVLVNKLRPGAVGAQPVRQVESVLRRFAGVEGPRVVPWDLDAVDAALLAGRLLHEVAPESGSRRAIQTLAPVVLGPVDPDVGALGVATPPSPPVKLTHS